jgi:hypothetical protein
MLATQTQRKHLHDDAKGDLTGICNKSEDTYDVKIAMTRAKKIY